MENNHKKINCFFLCPTYHGRTLHESEEVLGPQVSFYIALIQSRTGQR